MIFCGRLCRILQTIEAGRRSLGDASSTNLCESFELNAMSTLWDLAAPRQACSLCMPCGTITIVCPFFKSGSACGYSNARQAAVRPDEHPPGRAPAWRALGTDSASLMRGHDYCRAPYRKALTAMWCECVVYLIGLDWQGPKVAVHGLSFSVAKGDCFGFLGINGAGKSEPNERK